MIIAGSVIIIVIIAAILISLIALFVAMARANSGKSRDARKATWS